MADDTQGTGTADDDGALGGTDDTANKPPEGTDGDPGGADDDQGTDDGARKARREARALRERLKAAEAELDTHRKATETETQRVTRELEGERAKTEQLETRVRELGVMVQATRLGVRPEAADVVAGLIDWTEVDATDDADVAKAIKAILKQKPFLASGSEGLNGGEGRGAGGGDGTPNDLIRRLAGRR